MDSMLTLLNERETARERDRKGSQCELKSERSECLLNRSQKKASEMMVSLSFSRFYPLLYIPSCQTILSILCPINVLVLSHEKRQPLRAKMTSPSGTRPRH